ncbi:hypothetical protein Q0590_17495 [Rhodocytophaga aerolata]|uniref:DUF4177 domain-containing protein n=1 Tax=Rhodocytophaga aerolata TaxID=455078 RepID=A0ABT8R7K6_9BACT|nr:hypothetical protein [Rhodocytophaga aerolata]MDO1448072.1 hypothetical protein [Rhodocytophaga aerolata]
MKKILGILLWLGFAQAGFAQSKTIEYYIHLTAWAPNSGYLLGRPDLEMPALRSPLDSLVNPARIKEVLKGGNILDALNYFTQQGWQLVSTTTLPYGSKGDIETKVYYLY